MKSRSLRPALAALAVLFLGFQVAAQEPDEIVLKNGDRLSGSITVMSPDGVITLSSPILGDLPISLSDIETLTTSGTVTIKTRAVEVLERRITGMENGALQLAAGEQGAPAAPSVSIDQLSEINPPPTAPAQWTGSLNVGAGLTSGNTDNRSVSMGAEATRRTEQDRITAKFAWNYGDTKSAPGARTITERNVSGTLKYDYFLGKKAYLLATTGARGDTPADISLRFDAGTGVGYQWIEEENFSVHTEAGISYFNQQFRSMTPSISTVAGRAAYGLSWMFAEGASFLQDTEFLQGLEDANQSYVTADSRVRLSLTESMFTQGQWILNFNNTPSPGLDRVDHTFLVSVGWTF